MRLRLLTTIVTFLCVAGAKSDDFSDITENIHSEYKPYPTVNACYNKFVGFKGSVQSPAFSRAYLYSIVCEWDVDVTKGFVVEFEFEAFSLPSNKEQHCDSYLEISYGNQKNLVKRVFCPTDIVDRFYTSSQTAHLRFNSGVYRKEYKNHLYGFKINYSAVAIRKSMGNLSVAIVLLSFVALLLISLCACCIRRYKNVNGNNSDPRQVIIPQNPNAPTREQLQSAFEFRRCSIQAPHNESKYVATECLSSTKKSFPIFQSRTSSFESSTDRRESIPHPAVPSALAPLAPENRKISIATTPRSIFPESRRKWSEESARRIEQLRTKLVARFSSISSHGSSDISVFFPASDRRSYSQLSCEEDVELVDPVEEGKCSLRPTTNSRGVPSIVIEFVK